MLSKRVLYYDEDVAAQPVGERALLSAGFVPEPWDDPERLMELDPTGYDAFVLAPGVKEADGERFARLLGRMEETCPRVPVVLVLKQGAEQWTGRMLKWPSVRHMVARGKGARWATELRTVLSKRFEGEVFGLELYLDYGVRQHLIPVVDSRDKAAYVREVAELAARFELVPRMVELVETVVDELSTNAIFNAPIDSAGVPRYAHLNRRDPVVLEPEERAELRYACDGVFFAVAIVDPFGTLTRETVLGYLDRCVHRRSGEARPHTGGAGLGLFRAFRALSTLVFNLAPGVRTEVIGLIDIRRSMRQFKLEPKSLHFFLQERAL